MSVPQMGDRVRIKSVARGATLLGSEGTVVSYVPSFIRGFGVLDDVSGLVHYFAADELERLDA